MKSSKELKRLLRGALSLAVVVSFAGCGAGGPQPDNTNITDGGTNPDEGGTAAGKSYESPGGTSDLSISTGDTGAAVLKSFDPGAFVQTSSTPADDTLDPAEFDDGGTTAAPPPDDGGSTAPPPDDGGGTAPPPDDGTYVEPPPDDGTYVEPPPDGTAGEYIPPPDGTTGGEYIPPPDGTEGEYIPPPDGTTDGEYIPPPDGTTGGEYIPPPDGTDGEYIPPPDGTGDEFFFIPPDDFDGTLPPPPDEYFGDGSFFLPPEDFETDGAYTIAPPPEGFEGDGGFYAPPEGFDPDGTFFIPPEGFVGDAIYLPPPPEDFDSEGFYFPPSEGEFGEEGFEAPSDFFEVYADFPPPPPDFEGEWQPPPPQEWDGTSEWMPPPPEELYADGEWYPPPPPLGWEGEWFPPPPPPEGVVEFPEEFFFSNKFDEFFSEEFFVDGGFGDAPPPFEEFPFDAFLAEHDLHDIIPDAPPVFIPGAFGEFEFGNVPPPPPGFPEFPPPPEYLDAFGDFGAVFGSAPPLEPLPDGTLPPPPPDLPAEFFEFQEQIHELNALLEGFEFPPPPPPGEDGSFEGEFVPPFAFVAFDDVAGFLPDDFLLPDRVAEVFDTFGADHPLIGEGGVVNPDLESAMLDHPPIPEGFDGFDYSGDTEQFDDMFTVYDANNAGQTIRGQVNSTFQEVLDDGTEASFSGTTVVETVQEEAAPLIEMAPGVYQTQWVVNVRQLSNMIVHLEDPDFPDSGNETEQSQEILSQMTWTIVIREVDTDGDGVPDEMQVSGSNNVVVLSETIEGGTVDGFPPLPPPPPLTLPLDFQGVLDLEGAPPL